MGVDDNPRQDNFQQNPTDDTNPMYEMKKDEELPGDYDTPASPPSGVQDRINDTHPSTDTDIGKDEDYYGGIEEASGVDLPGETLDEKPEHIVGKF